MGKSRFPCKPGGKEGAKGVSINFRPQACSLPRRRLGSVKPRSPQGTHWESSLGSPGRGQNAEVLHHHLAAPSSLWEAWGRGLFTPCTHRRADQSMGSSAVRHSFRGPTGAHRAAPPPKLARGKRGSG